MKRIMSASLAAIAVLVAAGCGASASGPGFASSPVDGFGQRLAVYSSPDSSSPAWNPQIEKVWMVGNSEAMINRSPKNASQTLHLIHQLLKGAIRASGAPPVSVHGKAGHPWMEPFGPSTLYLKTSSGVYQIYPDYRIISGISSSIRITSITYNNGQVVSRTTKKPTLFHLIWQSPDVVIQKQGQSGRTMIMKDPALFQWLAKNSWVPAFR